MYFLLFFFVLLLFFFVFTLFAYLLFFFFFFNDTATTEIYTLSLHDALPIWIVGEVEESGEWFRDALEFGGEREVFNEAIELEHRGFEAVGVFEAVGDGVFGPLLHLFDGRIAVAREFVLGEGLATGEAGFEEVGGAAAGGEGAGGEGVPDGGAAEGVHADDAGFATFAALGHALHHFEGVEVVNIDGAVGDAEDFFDF